MARFIGVVSLKGGVGKTSVVVALGNAISNFGKKVLLVDGNLSAPNLGMHLDILHPEKTLHHVLAREAKPKEAIYEFEGFDLMPASFSTRLQVSPLKLKDRLNYLNKSYDYILLDSSPALNEETLGVMLASDEILVVTTPDHPTLSNTLKAVKLAKQRGTPISGLLLNKVHNKEFETSFRDVEDFLELPVLGVIPYDTKILEALFECVPSTKHKPRSKSSDEFKRLAAALAGEKYNSPKLKKFWKWINPERQDINRQLYYEGVFRD